MELSPPTPGRRALVLGALALALAGTALAAVATGGVTLPPGRVLGQLLRALGVSSAAALDAQQAAVLYAIRLPRVVLAVLVGVALGSAGAAMQGVFRNPLVDPGLLGLSNGAALGAVGAIVLGERLASGLPPELAPLVVPLCAFAGALLATRAVQQLARVEGRSSAGALLLAGIAVNALAGAFTGLLTFLANDAQVRSVTFWTLGSLGGATWKLLAGAAPFLVLPPLLILRLARPLDALLLGDADAGHLGFDVERVKRRVLVLVALMVGASVATSGVIGFVGLVVPHLVRLAAGADHRLVLPGAALLGAILLLIADALARTLVVPAELPLGVVTACLGTPFFVGLLVRERRRLA